MLKRKLLQKITITSIALLTLFLIYIIPSGKTVEPLDIEETVEYVDDTNYEEMFLIDQNNFVARAMVALGDKQDIESKVKEIISILTIGSGGENKVPNGFKAIIPEDTRIISLLYEEGLLKINFSKELLDVKKEDEEKLIEAIVYSLTAIDEIKNIIIYVEDEPLTKLPQTNITLPTTLDRSFGINKEYELTSLDNIFDVTIYYVNKYNDNYYYVPVTKYMNGTDSKINVIIKELSSGNMSSTNLMSFLNSNTKLQAVEELEDTLNLEFNSYIFSDSDKGKILEEVVYSICLSIEDNYDVENVAFYVENEEIYKTNLKSIE